MRRSIRQRLRPPRENLNRLKRLVDGLPEVRLERIRALKKAILEKTYHISSEDIARRLVNELAKDAIHRGKCGIDHWPSSS